VWLVHLKEHPRFVEVLSAENVGCSLDQAISTCCVALSDLILEQQPLQDWDIHNYEASGDQFEHYVQTRTGKGQTHTVTPTKRTLKSKNTVVVEPITNWVGKQLDGQIIPQTIKDRLQSDHPSFPSGILVLPSENGCLPRILVPKSVQSSLVLQAHLDIHHQHYRKVHKMLRPLYYWPGMDADIERICKECSICHLASVRRQKLQADFDAQAPQAYAIPRQHYGIDFYGVQGGEILVLVDLFTRETILEWLPSRKQESVVRIIMRRIIFERGVPFSIRSDNAPELMQGVMKQLCDHLNITQILTGGHNPRGNAICERANQTLGAMIRKLNDQEYKELRNCIPAFQFAMNITPHSAIGCSPFEAGHGLPATTLSSARLLASRYPHNHLEGQDGDGIEDSEPGVLQGKVKNLIELAMRMAEVAKSTSEWHRRMTAHNLGQNGRKIQLEKYKPGTKVYFYKPPSAKEAEIKGRKAKHMDHYAGPAIIIKQIGTRSFLIEYKNADGKLKTFQRDVGMLSLVPPKQVDFNPESISSDSNTPHMHRSLIASPMKEGEIVLLKDGNEATDWYCAQVVKVLPTHVLVHYYTTTTPVLSNYSTASLSERDDQISQAVFLKTWSVLGNGGYATTEPPKGIRKTRDIWSGKIKMCDLQDHLLVRNVELDDQGRLSIATVLLASKLKYPHHQGA
jgi:transposase InsO family protein